MVGVRGILVPPVKRVPRSPTWSTPARSTRRDSRIVTLNLAGELKSTADATGRRRRGAHSGHRAPFETAYKTLGLLPASLRSDGLRRRRTAQYFMAKQETLEVGFPRYRVLLYNTTGAGATVAFFAYRTQTIGATCPST